MTRQKKDMVAIWMRLRRGMSWNPRRMARRTGSDTLMDVSRCFA